MDVVKYSLAGITVGCVIFWTRWFLRRQKENKLLSDSDTSLAVFAVVAFSWMTLSSVFYVLNDLSQSWSENSDSKKIEAIALDIKGLLKQLPDLSVAEKHHKEIIDALGRIAHSNGVISNGHTSGGIGLTSVGKTVLFLTVLLLAIALVITFVASEWYWMYLRNGLLVLSMAPTLTFSLLDMGVLPKGLVEKMIGIDLRDMNLITFKTESPANTSPQNLDLGIHVTADETELDCGEGDNYRIGPFADGNAGDISIKPDEKLLAKLNKNIETLVRELTKNHLEQRPLGLILVGSADKRELKPSLFRFFGSNAGLAQARAEWVRKAIGNSTMRPKPKTILTLSSGPAHVGQDPLPEKDLADDRSVRVCAIWGSK